MAIDWGSIIEAGIKVGGQYLTERERQRHERDMARIQAQSGGGIGIESMIALIQLGAAMQQPRYQQPVPTPLYGQPAFQLPNGTTSLLPFTTTPTTPSTGGQAVPAIYSGPPYAVPAMGTYAYNFGGQLQGQTNGGALVPTTPPTGAVVATGGGTGPRLVNAPQLYVQTTYGGVRPLRSFIAVNPVSGALNWYRSAGRPILFSGDLSAAKRVRKIAARARASMPRKRVPARAGRR